MNSRLLLLIQKEKKIIFSGLIAGFILFIAYLTFFYTPLFKTSTMLFVKDVPKSDIVTTYDNSSIVRSESGFSNPLFNLLQLIKSEDLSSNVYDRLVEKYSEDLRKLGIKTKNKWHKKFSKLISVKIEPSTDVINLSVYWISKKNSQDILNIVVQEFKNINKKIRKDIEVSKNQFLAQQINEIELNLNNIRKEIKNYRFNNKAVDLDMEISELTKARVELEKIAEITKGQISFYDKKLKEFSEQLGIKNAHEALKATGIGEDAYLILLNQELAKAHQTYAKLQAKFTDNYPKITEIKNEIESIKENIEKRKNETLSDIKIDRAIYDLPSQEIVTDMARVQADSISLKAQLATIEQGIENFRQKENVFPEKVFNLNEMQKKEEALAAAYLSAKQKQMEAKIKENTVIDNIYNLGLASTPIFQLSIIINKLLGFLLFGFLAAFGIAWVKEGIEDKWVTAQEIEDVTGKNVLGVIPWVNSPELHSSEFIKPSNSIMGVAFRDIASQLSTKAYLKGIQTLAFISSVPGRNKPSIIPNIVNILSVTNKSVIIIDTDFSRPGKLLESIEIDSMPVKDLPDIIIEINLKMRKQGNLNDEELAEIISQAIIPIKTSKEPNNQCPFYYLSALKRQKNIYDFIANNAFSLIINFLKKHNDFIFIDSPPKPYIYPEITAISNICDSTIIISAMETNRESLIKIIKKLEKSNTNILGIIAREENSEIEKHFIDDANEGTPNEERQLNCS